jgi:hypothetical protein
MLGEDGVSVLNQILMPDFFPDDQPLLLQRLASGECCTGARRGPCVIRAHIYLCDGHDSSSSASCRAGSSS